jgi:hypothetical protein
VSCRPLIPTPQPTTYPCFHPVCRRPARLWSGRGSWRPDGARHCTNDLDARGRVCSALPGSMAYGMGASSHATNNARTPTGWGHLGA